MSRALQIFVMRESQVDSELIHQDGVAVIDWQVGMDKGQHVFLPNLALTRRHRLLYAKMQ